MIDIVNVTKQLNGKAVLDKVSFNIQDGEIFVIMGPSGTGKTVLLKHMIGLMKPDSGTITIDGVNVATLSEDKLLKFRRKFGYLFQEGALYDFWNIFDNVAFPLKEHTSMSVNDIKARVHEVLQLVDLPDVMTRMPSELSGGMKKRVGLARAIVLNPKILLCDEPTSGLDPIRSRDISDLIRDIARKIGSTLVMTSHDVFNSMRIADRVLLLNEGHIAALGRRDEIMPSSNVFVTEFLNASRV